MKKTGNGSVLNKTTQLKRLPDMTKHIPNATQGDLATLLEMLTYRRPHGSRSEAEFIKRFIQPVCDKVDLFGNLYRTVAGPCPILWSCHTDTVHHTEGRQSIEHDTLANVIFCGHDAEVLGADNAAGIWLMLQMIANNVPGTYVFHRAEERGGKGSRFISNNHEYWLKQFHTAIALDRKGTSSIITHQLGGVRGCSDKFANTLGYILKEAGGPIMKPDSTGLFTDTANYFGIIPHCTNLSVGYYNEHSSREHLDVNHLVHLRDALCNADFSTLIDCEPPTSDFEYDYYLSESNEPTNYRDLLEFAREYPEQLASALDNMGITISDICDYVEDDVDFD